MGEPSETYGDPDRMENLGERTRPGPGSDTTRLNRGDELSDTEMAQDDDLEREGERVLDEASDLEEDKDETSLVVVELFIYHRHNLIYITGITIFRSKYSSRIKKNRHYGRF
jgi:hypothetical protein